MTPNEFYEELSKAVAGSNVTLAPGPFKIKVGPADVYAAKVILWLQEQMPDGTTVGEFEDALLAALWWSQFWIATFSVGEDTANA